MKKEGDRIADYHALRLSKWNCATASLPVCVHRHFHEKYARADSLMNPPCTFFGKSIAHREKHRLFTFANSKLSILISR